MKRPQSEDVLKSIRTKNGGVFDGRRWILLRTVLIFDHQKEEELAVEGEKGCVLALSA